MTKTPGVSVDILIIRDHKVLLGLMTDQWKYKGRPAYGVPGRDIHFGETFGDTVVRNIQEELGCGVTRHRVFCVNANYALSNHYIGIGVEADINGEPHVLNAEDWVRWEWFDRDNLPDNLFPAARNVIDCWLHKRVNVAE